MNKLFLIAVIVLVFANILLIGGVAYANYFFSKPNIQENKFYQGPVRPTDDLYYFRLTGITRPIEVKK